MDKLVYETPKPWPMGVELAIQVVCHVHGQGESESDREIAERKETTLPVQVIPKSMPTIRSICSSPIVIFFMLRQWLAMGA